MLRKLVIGNPLIESRGYPGTRSRPATGPAWPRAGTPIVAHPARERNRNGRTSHASGPVLRSTGRTVRPVRDIALAVELTGALVCVPAGYAWLGRGARRRGIGGSVLAPIEEVWDPGAHRTNIEVQVQAEQRAPAPSPGDPPVR